MPFIRFETITPVWVILLFFFIAVLIFVRKYRPLKDILTPAYLKILYSVRILFLFFLFVMLLNPYYEEKIPDNSSFSIAMLADCSRSMDIKDCDGERRLDILAKLTEPEDGWLKKIRTRNRYNIRSYSFSEKLSTFTALPPTFMPGNTSLGDSMELLLKEFRVNKPAALVLISDGAENSGLSAIALAKKYAGEGIPITCIGVGGESSMGDLSVSLLDLPTNVKKGEKVKVKANVMSTFAYSISSEAVFKVGNRIIDRLEFTLPSGKLEEAKKTLTTTLLPIRAGLNDISVEVREVKNETVKDNNFDCAGIDVKEPDSYNILYLAANFNWEYKFLHAFAERTKRINIHSVIRSSHDGNTYRYNYEINEDSEVVKLDHQKENEEQKEKRIFPFNEKQLAEYDVLLVDLRICPFLSEKDAENISKFVDNRGGGILFFGKMDNESRFKDLLPIKSSFQGNKITRIRKKLHFDDNPIFDASKKENDIQKLEDVFYLPQGTHYYTSGKIKKGARSAMLIDSIYPVLSYQAYGAGRVSYIGIESSWVWSMESSVTTRNYEVFWKRLLVWLASSSLQRINSNFRNQKVILGESVELLSEIMDSSFSPDNNSVVKLFIKSPSGKKVYLDLFPSEKVDGYYSNLFTPQEAGKYEYELISKHLDLPAIKESGAFISLKTGREFSDINFNETLLKDISRISGGRYYRYNNIDSVTEFSLSDELPVVVSKHFFTHKWFFLVFILLILIIECYLRRRNGLK